MSCLASQTCLYVAGVPTASLWSGLPVLAVVLAVVLDAVLGGAVGRARRKYNVPYPNLYAVPGVVLQFNPSGTEHAALLNGKSENGAAATSAGAAADGPISAEAAYHFNCVQRGHQNTLEKLPLMLAMTVLSVFSFPLVGGFAAIVFVVGRAVYAWGYAQAPNRRLLGNIIGYVGQYALIGVTFAQAVQLFRGIGPY